MIIQHNMSAMIAGNANNMNVSGLKRRTEKLSTGYKINRAADNASGLAVSEKMRSQIRGLSQATNNANDAIPMLPRKWWSIRKATYYSRLRSLCSRRLISRLTGCSVCWGDYSKLCRRGEKTGRHLLILHNEMQRERYKITKCLLF